MRSHNPLRYRYARNTMWSRDRESNPDPLLTMQEGYRYTIKARM